MTTLTLPIAKLYKRCARSHHDSCPGAFETWSICSCQCHAGVSDERAAPAPEMPVTCADKHDAVLEAVAIVKRKAAPKAKASGLSTKTDKYAKWTNAIVAKNARANAAWADVQSWKCLYLAPGEGVPQSRFLRPADYPHCPHCDAQFQPHYGGHLTVCQRPNCRNIEHHLISGGY